MTIPTGAEVVLDVTTPELHRLTVLGTRTLLRMTSRSSPRWIIVHGTLQIGMDTVQFSLK